MALGWCDLFSNNHFDYEGVGDRHAKLWIGKVTGDVVEGVGIDFGHDFDFPFAGEIGFEVVLISPIPTIRVCSMVISPGLSPGVRFVGVELAALTGFVEDWLPEDWLTVAGNAGEGSIEFGSEAMAEPSSCKDPSAPKLEMGPIRGDAMGEWIACCEPNGKWDGEGTAKELF